MSIIKSFSAGNGDMFYINHNSDNFTTIDCCYEDDAQPLTATMKMMTVEMKISVKLKLWHQIKGPRDLFLHIPMKTIFSVY